MVRIISLDDMNVENIWLSCSKPSNYQERLRCHACYTWRTNERRKVKNSAIFCNYQINSINILMMTFKDDLLARCPCCVNHYICHLYIAQSIVMNIIKIIIINIIIKIIVEIIKFDLRPDDLHARGPCCVNPFLQMHSPFRHSDSATC